MSITSADSPTGSATALPQSAWRWFEPRFGFPIFKGIRTYVSFSVRPDFQPLQLGRMHLGLITAAKRGSRELARFARERIDLAIHCRQRALLFRLLLLRRDGSFLASHAFADPVPPGGSIDVDVDEVRKRYSLADDDMMGILVMSNGRHDAMRSSPGSYSMTYVGEKTYTTYRTGGFARLLNEKSRKKHHGFRGINPKILVTADYSSSVLLINHSSDPSYADVAKPRCVLLREDGQSLEADFGEIPAFGGLERSMDDLFGASVADFLAPSQGRGTTIITCPGITLASLHLLRRRDGTSMAIEHSRPTHTYLLHGVPI